MTVAITSLGERLVAVLATEGSQAEVRPHVVHHVAQLGEGLGARQALQGLVLAPGLLVQIAHLLEAPLLVDPLRRLVSRDFLLRHRRRSGGRRHEGFLSALRRSRLRTHHDLLLFVLLGGWWGGIFLLQADLYLGSILGAAGTLVPDWLLQHGRVVIITRSRLFDRLLIILVLSIFL